MNMNRNPTHQELRDLIRGCNDAEGHHVLWVAKNGDVHISTIPKNMTPAEFAQAPPDMQLRYETFQAGNEYVGPDAANDDEWINQLFDALEKEWASAKDRPSVEYVDQF